MNNLNPYNENQFKQTFKHTEIYKKLTLDFDENDLVWNKFFFLSLATQSRVNLNNNTLEKSQPRFTEKTPRAEFSNKFSASIFYYLMPLIEYGYTTIYDLGCGANMFKPYLPNLLGIGAETIIQEKNFTKSYNDVKAADWPNISSRAEFKKLPSWIQDECIDQHHFDMDLFHQPKMYGDIDGYVDDNYVACHQNYFESVFSICALHFHPIDQFCKVVEDFASMVQINGRGFISINLQRMIDSSSTELLISLFGNVQPTQAQLDQYVRYELDKINLEWLIIDVDLMVVADSMNGNIRLVFKK